MTFLVFSVLPAPDSPLYKGKGGSDQPTASQLRRRRKSIDVRDEHALALAPFAHTDPGPLGDGEDMGCVVLPLAIAILLDVGVRVDRQCAVRIDGDEEET